VDYPLVIEPDDNETLLVTCPDLPEVTTFGEDEEDALQHASDAIEEALAARMAPRSVSIRPCARPASAKPSSGAASAGTDRKSIGYWISATVRRSSRSTKPCEQSARCSSSASRIMLDCREE